MLVKLLALLPFRIYLLLPSLGCYNCCSYYYKYVMSLLSTFYSCAYKSDSGSTSPGVCGMLPRFMVCSFADA